MPLLLLFDFCGTTLQSFLRNFITHATEDEMNLADIILCPEYINEDLPRWNRTFQERVDILLVHGICHFFGHEHIDCIINDSFHTIFFDRKLPR